jgi:hypothetical protein
MRHSRDMYATFSDHSTLALRVNLLNLKESNFRTQPNRTENPVCAGAAPAVVSLFTMSNSAKPILMNGLMKII